MERIGVVGLGRMGSAIAQRMTAEGLDVRGWTRSGRIVDGVAIAPDLGSLVSHSDIVILSLLNDAAVAETLDAILGNDLAGKLIIETSTVTPGVLMDRIDAIRDKGATAVDAPISGGPELVQAGACGIFIGGDNAAAERAQKTLSAISGRIFHVGPLGAGLVMKTINNSMIHTYLAGLADLMPLARAGGMPLETVIKIVAGGPAGMPVLVDRVPRVLGEDDSVGFDIRSAFKDNHVFREVLASYGLRSPTMERLRAQEDAVEKAGLWDHDVAALISLAYGGEDSQ